MPSQRKLIKLSLIPRSPSSSPLRALLPSPLRWAWRVLMPGKTTHSQKTRAGLGNPATKCHPSHLGSGVHRWMVPSSPLNPEAPASTCSESSQPHGVCRRHSPRGASGRCFGPLTHSPPKPGGTLGGEIWSMGCTCCPSIIDNSGPFHSQKCLGLDDR